MGWLAAVDPKQTLAFLKSSNCKKFANDAIPAFTVSPKKSSIQTNNCRLIGVIPDLMECFQNDA